jgi:hypoxanthine phosphoribosyltransferase
MSSASACLPILKTALAKGGAIPGRLVGDMLVVEETHSSVREASTAHAG